MSEPLAHVAIPTGDEPVGVALPGQVCNRCQHQVKPPYYEDDVRPPVCWTCRARPCEGYSAFCHECQCSGELAQLLRARRAALASERVGACAGE